MTRSFITLASLMALFAVALGAFGAHGLKSILTPDRIAIFETGVRYHFYHSFAIFLIALTLKSYQSRWIQWSGCLFFIGILFFSGSLYLLACRDVLNIAHWTWLGPITPIGGMCFIIGWLLAAIGINKAIKIS